LSGAENDKPDRVPLLTMPRTPAMAQKYLFVNVRGNGGFTASPGEIAAINTCITEQRGLCYLRLPAKPVPDEDIIDLEMEIKMYAENGLARSYAMEATPGVPLEISLVNFAGKYKFAEGVEG